MPDGAPAVQPCDAVEPRRPRRGVLAHGLRYQLPSPARAGDRASTRLPLLGGAAGAGDGELPVERGDLAARTRRGGEFAGGGGRVGAPLLLLGGRGGGARWRLGLDGGHSCVSGRAGFRESSSARVTNTLLSTERKEAEAEAR